MTVKPKAALLLCCVLLAPAGCDVEPEQGQGPGHRQQQLGLTPAQELELGRKAYRQVLSESKVLPHDSPQVRRVAEVGERIAATTKIEPLMREINLDVKDYRYEWEFNVLEDPHVNAFCLPGGKVAVFTGLLKVVQNNDQLAAVLGHETAHALAHHSSERLAEQQREGRGVMAALREKAFDRGQESEADHIGVFLMAFAGYDPRQAVVFWKRMKEISDQQGRVPEILSDHPSDAKRIKDLEGWAPRAEAAYQAYKAGRVEPHGR